ncbi:hypothetical protein MH117_26125 [Paenibacillus sp. ACRRX]|uniref:hypothetical protein n=1 Tax=Paenibacillus sp. ACRRX TaxID=2918206 RepID=UPI001EF71654|nr:hypothetical protein [Paenibacillus sp. ACRRX]MCG7410867.1 hypothetical protein [Paenibacillus sp. ACRRX]
MALLKDSSTLDEYKASYAQLWDELQHVEEEKFEKIIENMRYELLPTNKKLLHILQPFKTHLLWLIPLSVIGVLTMAYVLFIWISLLVE